MRPAHTVGIKIGQFIYPWGGGHYSRMMRFDCALRRKLADDDVPYSDIIAHYSSKGRIYQRLRERFAATGDDGQRQQHVHEILMPTPIDGSMGPSLSRSLANILLPIDGNPPLVSQIAGYLRQERRLYDGQGFDLVVSDGDVGSNILARNRNIPCLFITNQFKPRLYRSRSYLYPALVFVARQIAKATKILVADSPPPHTICEYNLNFPDHIKDKVTYVGHFADDPAAGAGSGAGNSDLAMLLGQDGGSRSLGYWMRTGNKSTNDGTGRRYEEAFAREEMRSERRIISHARDDPGIDAVTGTDGKKYGIAEAAAKEVDWLQIDVGFLSEGDKNAVLDACDYAVINGSHTVMGEIMGGKAKPIIGVPIYDEHTNNIRWAHERGLGVLANDTSQIISAIRGIREDASGYSDRLAAFARNFDGGGAQNAARIASETLQE